MTATRASSPARPGTATFPSSPTQKAEKTTHQRGHGGGTACLMTTRQADDRTATEKRLIATASPTQNHETARKASPIRENSGWCQTRRAARIARSETTSATRPALLAGIGRRTIRPRPAP